MSDLVDSDIDVLLEVYGAEAEIVLVPVDEPPQRPFGGTGIRAGSRESCHSTISVIYGLNKEPEIFIRSWGIDKTAGYKEGHAGKFVRIECWRDLEAEAWQVVYFEGMRPEFSNYVHDFHDVPANNICAVDCGAVVLQVHAHGTVPICLLKQAPVV